jgi:Tfp pilus assembly protein FimV
MANTMPQQISSHVAMARAFRCRDASKAGAAAFRDAGYVTDDKAVTQSSIVPDASVPALAGATPWGATLGSQLYVALGGAASNVR